MDTNIFDLLIGASGIYLIYTAVMMKKTGEIKTGVIVSREADIHKMRDKEGFINYMFGKVLLIGALTVLAAIGNVLRTYYGGPVWIAIIANGCYLAVLFFYAAASSKAKKMFID